MAKQTINTVIVLRNDQTTNWESSGYKLLKGEVGIGYLENGNVIAKLGVDGQTAWKDLPQIEGVLEKELTLTHDFGRYKTSNGFVKTSDAKGKTISQWLIHALSETKEPTITQPTITMTADGTGAGGEIGSYITKLNWYGTFADGSYEYGPATGLSVSNVTWSVSNNIDNQKGTTEAGSFTLDDSNKIRLTQEESKEYAKITATYTLDASKASTPINNIGVETTSKITDKTDTIVKAVNSTAYRKPFWGVLAAGSQLDVTKLTSKDIRNLASSGKSNGGLPTSLDVPAGSRMVIFAAKAGTKSSLTATDDKAMNAGVDFTKVANAVKVEGANGFKAVDYDIWYVDWLAGISVAKKLTLKWA